MIVDGIFYQPPKGVQRHLPMLALKPDALAGAAWRFAAASRYCERCWLWRGRETGCDCEAGDGDAARWTPGGGT